MARIALVLPILGGVPAITQAATLVVTTTADNSAADGLCSLREAMVNANTNAGTHADCAAGAGDDVIAFAVSGTITLSSSLPIVTLAGTLTIDGSGRSVVISGNGLHRPFRVDLTTLTLIRLTITRGFTTDRGGAVRNDGTLVIRNSTILDNEVRVGAGSVASGGAIYSEGALTIVDSTISGNRAIGTDGANANGGGIRSAENGVLSISGSTIANNTATAGGVTARGGGISINGEGPHVISNTTISGNAAEALAAPKNTDGGGVATAVVPLQDGLRLTVTNSTITGNRTDGSPLPSAAGIMGLDQVVLRNNLIAGNLANGASSDCGGQFSADAPNLIHDGNCIVTGTPPISALPLLGPLANNGGPTPTHALLGGSPGIGAASAVVCAAAPLNSRDQRGAPRTGSCDLGAFERSTGGWGLRITSSAGTARLDWSDGELETGYFVLRYNLSTGAQTLLPGASPFGPTTTTLTDTPVAGQISCYIVLAMVGSTLAGTSDFLCAMPGVQSGAFIPSGFTMSVLQGGRAALSWAPPAGATGHAVYLVPLNGSPGSFVGVSNAGFAELTLAGPSCAILLAFDAGGAFSYTNMLCGFPPS